MLRLRAPRACSAPLRCHRRQVAERIWGRLPPSPGGVSTSFSGWLVTERDLPVHMPSPLKADRVVPWPTLAFCRKTS